MLQYSGENLIGKPLFFPMANSENILEIRSHEETSLKKKSRTF